MAYIWASPNSARVGLNLGKFQSGLTRQADRYRGPDAQSSQAKKTRKKPSKTQDKARLQPQLRKGRRNHEYSK